MECLDANVVQDLMSGALDEAARASVLGHLDTCEDCRELVGTTAKLAQADPLGATRGDTMPPPVRTSAPHRSREPTAKGPLRGRYVLDEKLGEGAMGVVWAAHDPRLGRRVALKLLRRYDPALIDRLVREARSMAQVSHPNVVGVFDVGETEGAAFIAMELVTGRSLRAWQTDESRAISDLVTAYVAAGRGLAAAHGAGIVHRDFKADNVLVGDDGRIRVTDFGLATIVDVDLTTSGSVLGTPAYMAPEQFSGGDVDPRTDQFNFCVSLYEALYGERPFEGQTYDELAANVIAGKLRPAPAGTQVSGGLRQILARGLAARPAERFPSLDHLLDELARDRARPWRRAGGLAIAVAVALAIGLVADGRVRDRIAAQVAESFELTGVQVDKTMHRVENEFELASKVAYSEPALREVAGHHDQADFGLGTAEADAEDLEKLHGTLASMQWKGLASEQRAIVDSKGRLLFTSFAPQVWNTDMRAIPAVRHALDAGTGSSLLLTSYADPMFAPSKVFGDATPPGLVLVHLQTLALGNHTTGANEARAILLQFEDVGHLLEDLRLDPETRLAIVAPNHTSVADDGLTADLVAVAPRDGIAQIHDRGHDDEVLQFPISDREHHEIGHVVMARRVDGIRVLFPHARVVFALALVAALGVAGATLARARRLTSARAA